ncbi:MAG: nucleotidyl transferase AbiEii/AbiGii toxin family protein [Chlamydiia bacterium]|nr:nucleotidyl transferase AbiEii/AbiGii toxin family protein [Chlamydiia bacterium]
MQYDPVQYIEFFHLLFLEHLGRKLDKRLYALKGGCNLRFFLGSIRYSQDIDLDVKTVRVATLQKIVQTILGSQSFVMMLQSRGLEITQSSEPKQTETTQRWKIQLQTGAGLTLPTKIEFSRRGLESPVEFESIDPMVLTPYRLPPLFVPHYGPVTAFQQKIKALALRTETQARDVWDLFHLINAYTMQKLGSEYLRKACENACNIHFADFKDQVLAFFPSELQSRYNAKMWEDIQLKVIEHLEALQ